MEPYIIAFLGALTNEVLHWYNLRRELSEEANIIQTKSYWIITAISILTFTIATQYVYEFILPNADMNTRLFITALLFPNIIKDLLKVVVKSIKAPVTAKNPDQRREILGESKNQRKSKFTLLTYLK